MRMDMSIGFRLAQLAPSASDVIWDEHQCFWKHAAPDAHGAPRRQACFDGRIEGNGGVAKEVLARLGDAANMLGKPRAVEHIAKRIDANGSEIPLTPPTEPAQERSADLPSYTKDLIIATQDVLHRARRVIYAERQIRWDTKLRHQTSSYSDSVLFSRSPHCWKKDPLDASRKMVDVAQVLPDGVDAAQAAAGIMHILSNVTHLCRQSGTNVAEPQCFGTLIKVDAILLERARKLVSKSRQTFLD